MRRSRGVRQSLGARQNRAVRRNQVVRRIQSVCPELRVHHWQIHPSACAWDAWAEDRSRIGPVRRMDHLADGADNRQAHRLDDDRRSACRAGFQRQELGCPLQPESPPEQLELCKQAEARSAASPCGVPAKPLAKRRGKPVPARPEPQRCQASQQLPQFRAASQRMAFLLGAPSQRARNQPARSRAPWSAAAQQLPQGPDRRFPEEREWPA